MSEPPTPQRAPRGQRVGTPAPGHDTVAFATRGSSPATTVLLGVAALAGAGVTVYLAARDQLPHPSGLVAAAVTLVLVFVLTRVRSAGTTISIEQGIVTVDDEEGRRRFDLTAPATVVELVGDPGDPGWKVLLHAGRHPFGIDGSMVDPVAFTEAVRRWRPDLK